MPGVRLRVGTTCNGHDFYLSVAIYVAHRGRRFKFSGHIYRPARDHRTIRLVGVDPTVVAFCAANYYIEIPVIV